MTSCPKAICKCELSTEAPEDAAPAAPAAAAEAAAPAVPTADAAAAEAPPSVAEEVEPAVEGSQESTADALAAADAAEEKAEKRRAMQKLTKKPAGHSSLWKAKHNQEESPQPKHKPERNVPKVAHGQGGAKGKGKTEARVTGKGGSGHAKPRRP